MVYKNLLTKDIYELAITFDYEIDSSDYGIIRKKLDNIKGISQEIDIVESYIKDLKEIKSKKDFSIFNKQDLDFGIKRFTSVKNRLLKLWEKIIYM